jgi:hypothetical protein
MKKYLGKVDWGPVGKINAVVCKRGEFDYYYRFYDHLKNRRPPQLGSNEWKFVRCADFMSTSDSRRKMTWDPSCRPARSKPSKPRARAQNWEIREVGKALFDHPSDFDEDLKSRKRKRGGSKRTKNDEVSLEILSSPVCFSQNVHIDGGVIGFNR